MNRSSRLVAVAWLLALALLAGPAAAACAACCPSSEGPPALGPAAGCCRDCPETVEGPTEPAAAALLRAAAPEPASLGVLALPQVAPMPPSAGAAAPIGSKLPAFSPPRTLAPLRL